MSLAYASMSPVSCLYVLVCHPYVTRMYSYVTRMYWYVIDMPLVLGFIMNRIQSSLSFMFEYKKQAFKCLFKIPL